ncbi:non-homologous end joining protein Ku [Desertivirga brevis]|uniref:non-homologous end joining protein Ku n=1 Tax=Desertivirga brevis TaxID=2810310 RepID=UPI001A961EDD|nr:Ku protein [Pedobacter sp. SYSU D00873]
MRSIWKGSIGFGLVNIPIKLYSAVQSSSLGLDMLDSRDHSRIRYQRINEKTRKEVPYDQIVKGYPYNEGYVILEDKDFDEAAPEKSKMIEIENFVNMDEVNPIYYETAYYAEPETQGRKAYALLHKALQKSKKAGLGRFVLRTSENLCILHPLEKVIVISKIRFAEEVRSSEEILTPDNVEVSKKELDMGLALINQYSAKLEIEKFKDEYHHELLRIIELKAKGKQPTIKKLKPKKASDDNLYEMLMQSLDTSRKGA